MVYGILKLLNPFWERRGASFIDKKSTVTFLVAMTLKICFVKL